MINIHPGEYDSNLMSKLYSKLLNTKNWQKQSLYDLVCSSVENKDVEKYSHLPYFKQNENKVYQLLADKCICDAFRSDYAKEIDKELDMTETLCRCFDGERFYSKPYLEKIIEFGIDKIDPMLYNKLQLVLQDEEKCNNITDALNLACANNYELNDALNGDHFPLGAYAFNPFAGLKKLANNIGSAVSNVYNGVKDTVSSAVNSVKDFVQNTPLPKTLNDLLTDPVGTIGTKITNASNTLNNKVDKVKQDIGKLFSESKFGQGLMSAGEKVGEFIKDPIGEMGLPKLAPLNELFNIDNLKKGINMEAKNFLDGLKKTFDVKEWERLFTYYGLYDENVKSNLPGITDVFKQILPLIPLLRL